MSCQYYADFARNCIETFKDVVFIQDDSICNSSMFEKCRLYQILISEKPPCEFYDHCNKRIAGFKDDNFEIDDIFDYIERFCFSEKKDICSQYIYLKKDIKK